jgi:hypothetical protein
MTFVLSVVDDVHVTAKRNAYGDFINPEDLPTRSSKKLLEVGFARVFS